MIKEINRFIKVFDTFFKSWDFYGIELINSKEKVTVSIDNFDYEVPLIEIYNPNDLPYTLANLYASFQDDFISNIQSLAGTNLSNYTILKLCLCLVLKLILEKNFYNHQKWFPFDYILLIKFELKNDFLENIQK